MEVTGLIERLREIPAGWWVRGTTQNSLQAWEPGGHAYAYVFPDGRPTRWLTSQERLSNPRPHHHDPAGTGPPGTNRRENDMNTYDSLVTEARGLLGKRKQARARLIALTVEALADGQITQRQWAADTGAEPHDGEQLGAVPPRDPGPRPGRPGLRDLVPGEPPRQRRPGILRRPGHGPGPQGRAGRRAAGRPRRRRPAGGPRRGPDARGPGVRGSVPQLHRGGCLGRARAADARPGARGDARPRGGRARHRRPGRRPGHQPGPARPAHGRRGGPAARPGPAAARGRGAPTSGSARPAPS